VSEEIRANIAEALEKTSKTVEIRNVHSVRVRATPDGMVVNYHCRLNPHLTVSEVHARVDELDRKMRDAFRNIVRIVGHAEPMRE
jgi:divalent metal cation (Fe/Co/Zn/Cd) transporter